MMIATAKQKFPWNGLILLILLFLAMWHMVGCCSYSKCYEKYGETNSEIVYREKLVEVPYKVEVPVLADSISASINIDSLSDVTNNLVSVIEGQRARLHWYQDSQNRLQITAECLTDTITVMDTIRERVEVPVTVNNTTFKPPKNPKLAWHERISLTVGKWVLSLFLLAVIITISRWAIRMYVPGLNILNWIRK